MGMVSGGGVSTHNVSNIENREVRSSSQHVVGGGTKVSSYPIYYEGQHSSTPPPRVSFNYKDGGQYPVTNSFNVAGGHSHTHTNTNFHTSINQHNQHVSSTTIPAHLMDGNIHTVV